MSAWYSPAATAETNGFSVDTIHLPLDGGDGGHVALHCARLPQAARPSVLFIHGASFPTALASGFLFDRGDSWIDVMARRGYLACGLDFQGFGGSGRPDAMRGAADASPPVAEAKQAAREIALAVDYLRKERGIDAIHLVAHSWGTIPAAAFAAEHAGALASLTLFGPFVPLCAGVGGDMVHPAWWSITAAQRYEQLQYRDVLPPGMHLLEPAMAERWPAAFEASVPHVAGDERGMLRIPAGPLADIDAATAGIFPYAADRITVPVFVVYGNHDDIVDDDGAGRFLDTFTASPLKWRLRIDDGTHVMHLERNRRSLYESVDAFIRAVGATS